MSDTNPVIDLGDSHTLQWSRYKDDAHAGATVAHKKPDGSDCAGFISIAGGQWAKEFESGIATWTLESVDPVTLSPSLLCVNCGDHGFVRQGKWVRA